MRSSIKNVIYQQFFKFLKDSDLIYEKNIVIEIKKEVKTKQKVNVEWEVSMNWNIRLFRTDVIERIILALLSDVS
jgi:hypothetical protein